MFPSYDEILTWLPELLGGLSISLQVTALSLLVGIPFGLVLALGVLAMVPRWWRHRRMSQRQSRTPAAPLPTVPEQTTGSPPDIALAQPPREGL